MIKDIPGYEGIYAADDSGKIWSHKTKKFLKAGIRGKGYLAVDLSGVNKSVHRLVAKTFLQNYSEDLDVDHIDNNRSNNNVTNLQMLTHADNMKRKMGKGYCWRKDRSKWQAYIKKDKKLKFLGLFDKEDDARAAYLTAKALYHRI
jgi:hypothetical protein